MPTPQTTDNWAFDSDDIKGKKIPVRQALLNIHVELVKVPISWIYTVLPASLTKIRNVKHGNKVQQELSEEQHSSPARLKFLTTDDNADDNDAWGMTIASRTLVYAS